jgi:RNA polymerase sigma-70 factor (ECF subfamily)
VSFSHEDALQEAQLVEALKRGDERAWDLAHSRHAQDLYAGAVHLLGKGPDAENALQEAWLTAHLKIQSFEWRGPGSLFGWLRQICTYKAFETMRGRHRQLATDAEALEALSLKAAHAAHEQAEARSAQQALVGLIRRVIAQMGEPCARLLDQRELQGKSYAQLAALFRWPLGTVMTRLARCRRLLRQAVESLLGEAP